MVQLEEFMEIFRLREMGVTISSISRQTGLDRKTIRKYLKQGKSKAPSMAKRKQRRSKLCDYEDMLMSFIIGKENEWPPATVIYEELLEHGYDGSLSLVQKWLKSYRQSHFPRVVIRYETEAGRQAQVDWGEKKITDAKTGLTKKVYIFCMTLSWSRNRFVYFFPKADMYYFLLGHQKAFAYFGGVPKEILYDQNRCVVLKPGIKNAQYNNKFMDFARHYGFHPHLCRPYRPQTKGKVENLVGYVKGGFLTIQNTTNLSILNQNGRSWLLKVNNKVHSTTGKIPAQQLEKEGLKTLDGIGSYELYYMESRKVFNDSTFSFHGRRYSVPPKYIARTVTVKYRPGNMRLDVSHNNQLITQHRRDSGGENYVIKRSHRFSIWRILRYDKKLYYQQAWQMKKENHPLAAYEQIAKEEAGHAQSIS
jgi:transposase